MTGPFRKWLEALGDIFWIRPAVLVLLGIALGEAAVLTESSVRELPSPLRGWIYSGGESGARASLGAVAASSIGVAGTTFSITVAALSLASGQMGPRLLRNFIRDAGNQYALGVPAFLAGDFPRPLLSPRRQNDVVPDLPHRHARAVNHLIRFRQFETVERRRIFADDFAHVVAKAFQRGIAPGFLLQLV